MIRCVCRYVALTEISDLPCVDEYEKMVRPLSYDFGVEPDVEYGVIGIVTRRGTPWFYIADENENADLQIVPAALFAFDWTDVPPDWRIRIVGRGDVQLIPASLAAIDRWYEKYVDEDATVLALVRQQIRQDEVH